MSILKTLGNNVRFLRERKGWSQDKLSDVSNLHRTYISGVERGLRNPTVLVIEKMAKALDVSAARLLEERS